MVKRADDKQEHAAGNGRYERLPLKDIHFDPKNPRLAEFALGEKPTQSELLRILWKHMAVDEIAMSLSASGYFEHEPLLVTVEDGPLYVIEGNRRLAAAKLLSDADLRAKLKATDLPKATAERIRELATLPVIRTTRKQAWRYLGFKHVNGPAKWGSYAKARYIAEVRNDFGESLEKIAEQIGDKHTTVQRLYRGLMVIEQAEEAKVFSRENRWYPRFYFSHMYTGLDYEGFYSYLNLTDKTAETKRPVPASHINRLGELCTWLYGNRRDEIRPVIQSQNPDLKLLDDVLLNERAVDTLRTGMPLAVAHEVSLGDERVFRESLQNAKLNLQKARGTLSTGYDGELDLRKLADEVSSLAYDLAEEMERKVNPTRRKKR